MSKLNAAVRALADGNEPAALDGLLAAWRATRATELGELVGELSRRFEPHLPRPAGKLDVFQSQWLALAKRRRAADLPILLATILETTQRSGVAIVEALLARGEALLGWPADPRTSAGIAAHMTIHAFGAMSKGSQPFWRSVFQLLADQDDPAATAAFAKLDFAKVFKGWNDVATRIAFMQTAVDDLVAGLRRRHPEGPPALPAALKPQVAAMKKAIAALPPVAPDLARQLGAAPSARGGDKATSPKPRAVRASPSNALARLAVAGHALENADDEGALAALLDAWRATPSPRIGELVDAISARIEVRLSPITGDSRAEIQNAWLALAKQQRPADLPRLLASVTHTHHRATDALARVRALAHWPRDPRAASGAIANLESIPFHTSSTKPFWSALIELATSHADLRTATTFRDLAKRLTKILRSEYADLTSMRAWFGKQMLAAATAIESQFPGGAPALDREHATACDRLADQIRNFADPGERLLAEVASHPDDDHARQVYADFLQERDDPRGELIALQLAERDVPRQEALIAKHVASWLGPLAKIAWPGGTELERGFPVEIWLSDARNTDALERVVGHPIWATVRRLHLTPDFPLPVALIRHPVMRSLVHISSYDSAPILEVLGWDRVPYTSFGIDSELAQSRSDQRAFLAAAPKLKHLRAIELGGSWFTTPSTARWLLESPIAKHLDHVALADPCDSLADWVKAVERTPIPKLRVLVEGRWGGWLELSRDRAKKLSIAHAQIGGYPGRPKPDPEALSYTTLADLLSTLAPRSLSKLHVRGRPPTPKERGRFDAACGRFTKLTVELALAPAVTRS